jgi:hypothetical protein
MKFATQARVTVPGTEAQAVILDATETIIGFPVYTLRWLDEAGEQHTGTCGEGDLAGRNPTEADVQAACDQAKAMLAEAERFARIRVRQIAARKRKASHKRKR